MHSQWDLQKYDQYIVDAISQQLGISRTIAILLNQRGIDSVAQAKRFIQAELEDLTEPTMLTGITVAVQRIEKAILAGEKVVIYGDYDVDGICSTVLMVECLTALGCQVGYYVPSRFIEGYGLNCNSVEYLAQRGYSLLITVDCGITSVEETKLAKSYGMEMIITDHHTLPKTLPEAVAVINPRLDNNCDNSNLAGAGVAFALVRALCKGKIPDDQVFNWLDLVALATIADIVPLLGDNRILVKHGLDKLQNTSRMGLKALFSETGLDGIALTPWHVGFVLAPRLNAAGRLDNAATSIELLLCQNLQIAKNLAAQLCALNNQRRAIEDNIFKEAVFQVDIDSNLKKQPILVLAAEGWHQGVIGIVASRLADRYNRPVILISWEGNQGHGSGRSHGDFDLYQALYECRECLLQFGGHRLAAGLSIEKDQFGDFQKMMWEQGRTIAREKEIRKYRIDIELEYDDINNKLLEELKLLHPYGEGNPYPSFAMRAAKINNPLLVGKKKDHLKCKIGSRNLDAIAFNGAGLINLPWRSCCQDIVFNLEENEFRGSRFIQLNIKDMKCSFTPDKPGKKSSVASLYEVCRKAAQQIHVNQPVLFVYPTYRSLTKHLWAVNRFFLPGAVKVLHGRLQDSTRKAVQKQFFSGEAGIFLITEPYFKYLSHRASLPDNLHYIVLIWLQDENQEWGKLGQRFELDKIPAWNSPLGNVQIRKGWHYSGSKRTIVYANRLQTLEKLNNRFAHVSREAGITSLSSRRLIRREFYNARTGALICDGACTSDFWPLENVDEVVFADVPYGNFEVAALLEQVKNNEGLEISLLFDQQDITFNRSYLSKTYPNIRAIKDVWFYFQQTGCKPITAELKEITGKISSFLEQPFSPSHLLPILLILSELGLCQAKKKGSIMEIKFTRSATSILDISESPYYLEGVAEKKAFCRLENELHKYLTR
ncbi:MAG: single-stranded-DNA-specific exonuclease RecJ [Syntrophomonadaceae bacterium]